MKTASTVSDSASEELSTPQSLAEALDTGFLPDNDHYRLTGEFEKPQPAKKDDAASSTKDKPAAKEGDAPPASEQEEEPASKAAASATAETQRGSRREPRWEKRERELKEARAEIARLKSGQSSPEAQRSEARQEAQPATETAKPGKAAPKPQIDDVDAQGKPKFKSLAEYEDAKDAWLRQEIIRELNESQAKSQQLTAQDRERQEIGKAFEKKFEAPRAKYPDFDKVALGEHWLNPKGSVTDLFLIDSEHAGEVAYYLGQHPEITASFYRDYDPKTGKFTSLITPQRQFRKLMAIEAEVAGSGSQRSSNSSSARPVTQASRPPHQVSGQGTVAKEAVEQAVEDGDFESYMRTQNAKDIARQKRK